MKTPPINTTSKNPAKVKSVETSARKPFSKVLENRRGKEKLVRGFENAETREKKSRSNSEESVTELPILPGSSIVQPGEVTTKGSAQPVGLKEPIQALASEILHSVNAQGQQQIDIQLNSKVFDGLRIQIVKDANRVNIRFDGASETVAQVLNRNVGALTESLAAHGVRVGQIRVGEAESARWMTQKASSRSRTGGGQGRRRQS